MFTIGYAFYVFILATAFALLEIQIEGKNGWAKNLPCWRPDSQSILSRIYSLFMNGKELTGYHVVMFPIPLLILHFPFVAGASWTIFKELETLSMYFLMAPTWDFLWFVWNPAYGIIKFRPQFIPWHKKWIGPVPKDYPTGVAVSFILALVAGDIFGWLLAIIIFAFLTALSCCLTPVKKE